MITFDYAYAYEVRDSIHTSRWTLNNVSTSSSGLTDNGWLWYSTSTTGDTTTVTLYSDDEGTTSVATGSCDTSTVPVKCDLSYVGASPITGSLWVEDITEDVSLVPIKVSLAVDSDMSIYRGDLTYLSGEDDSYGMAEFLSAATKFVLLDVASKNSEFLGGAGGVEDKRLTGATRNLPDFRKIVVPDQLIRPTVFLAISIAYMRDHQRADDTEYSEIANYYREMYENEMSSMSLSLSSDPDESDDAEVLTNSTVIRLTRI